MSREGKHEQAARAMIAQLTSLRLENRELRALLQAYGDHTLDCYAATSARCTCGWAHERKAWGIRPRATDP